MSISDFLINKQSVTLLEVAQHLKITTDKLGRSEQLRIASALERLRWERGSRTTAAWYWIPKDQPKMPWDISK